MKRHLNREKGITIVSLIVTIIVLLILTSIALVSFNGDDIKDKTTNSKIYTELSQLSEKIEKIKISEEGERISNSIYTNTVNNEDLKSSGIGIVKTLKVSNPEMEIGVVDLEKLNVESTIGNNYKNINDSGTIAKLTDLSDVFFIEMETSKVYYIDKKIYSLQGNVLPEDVKGNSQQSDGPSITIGNVSVDNAHNKIQFSISASENNNVNLSSDNEYEYYISTSPTKLQGGEWKQYTSGNIIEETRIASNTYYIFVKPIKDEKGNESAGNTIVNGVKYHKSEGCVITNQITLAINPNGGKYNNSTETSYLFGNKGETTIDEIQDAEGPKYTIEYNGNGGTTPESQEAAMIFKNWTLKGKGTLRNKRFTFGDEDATLTARYNETAQEIKLQTSERNGYTFKGWYTATEEGTKVGDAGDTYTPTRDLSLYAQWDVNKYNVTLNPGTTGTLPGKNIGETQTIEVTYDSTYGTLPEPAREGYTFDGWFTAAEGGDQVTAESQVKITENQTLYAHWTANTYTVTINPGTEGTLPNKNKGETDTINATYDATYGTLPVPTRTGYTFDGWFTAQDGGDQITANTPVTITADQTLHAHWTAKTFTVTLNPGSEGTLPGKNKGQTDTKQVTYDSTYGELPTPTREAYAFVGWYTATSGGTQVTAETQVTITADQTLHARWISLMLKTGSDFKKAISGTNGSSTDTTIQTITFGNTSDYLDNNIVSGIESVQPITVDVGNTGIIKAYKIQNSSSKYDVYVLSDYEIFANTNAQYMFASLKNLTSLNLGSLNTSKTTDMGWMFLGCGYSTLTSLNLGSNFDTSQVTKMNSMFRECGYSNMTSLDLSGMINTSKVEDMSYMFNRCGYNKMTNLNLGNNFNTSKVNNMERMFWECGYKEMTSLDLGDMFNTSEVTNVWEMFYSCGYTKMSSLDLGDNFDTSKITSMSEMFKECGYKALTSLDLGNKFNTSKTKSMNEMFRYCGGSAMTNLNLGDKFDTSNVTDMAYMFMGCSKLENLNLGNKFDTSKVINMSYMFDSCGTVSMTSLDLGDKFDTSNVTDMQYMFHSCGQTAMTSLDLGDKFNTSKVTNMRYMFSSCGRTAMTSIDFGDKFDTSKVTNMAYMFSYCGETAMTSLDLGDKFDTSKVTNMAYMFNGCGINSMTSLDLGDKFDTSQVTEMQYMFSSCGKKAMTSLDLGDKFDTSKVTYMTSMFSNCGETAMTSLKLGEKFDTSKATNMASMFSSCGKTAMTSLDLGNKFNTSKVTSMAYMFADCLSLTSLDVSDFKTSNVTNMAAMFSGCSSLTSIDLSNFDISALTSTLNMFNGCKNLTTIYANKDWKNPKITSSNYMFSYCNQLVGAIRYDSNKISIDYANPTTGYFTTNMVSLKAGQDFNSAIKGDAYTTEDTTIRKVIFGRTSKYSRKIEGATPIIVDSANAGTINAYKVDDTVYVLSDNVICANADSSDLFSNLQAIEEFEFENFDISNITNSSNMFKNCSSIETIYSEKGGWDVSNITTSTNMFEGCTNIKGAIDYDTSKLDKNYANPETGYFTYEETLVTGQNFINAVKGGSATYSTSNTNIKKIIFGRPFEYETEIAGLTATAVDLNKTGTINLYKNTTNGTIYVISPYRILANTNSSYMFANLRGITEAKFDNLYTKNVTNMSYMFNCFGYNELTSLNLGNNFDTSNVNDMSYLFSYVGYNALTNLDLGDNFDTSDVMNMSYMFYYAGYKALTSLDLGDNFNTSNVTNMDNMFRYAGYNTLTNIDLGNKFNTSGVTNMNCMFANCQVLEELDLSGFNTSNVTDMGYMFYNCKAIRELELSRFSTESLIKTQNMFDYCSNLETIYAEGDWNTGNITNSSSMFYACSKLVGGAGTTYNSSKTSITYAHVDGGTSNPGYFTRSNLLDVIFNPGSDGKLPNKAKGETETRTVTKDATYGTLPQPTRTGYTFAGWFTEETGGTQITESTTVTITGVQTLYAHWNGEEYEITLNNQSATSAGTPSIYETYEEKYSLTSGGQAMTTSSNAITKPQRTGFTFGGYYTERNGEGTQVIDGNGFVTQGATAKEFSSNGTLYAKWTDTTNPSLVIAKETTQDGFEDWELSGGAFIDNNGYLNLPDSTSEAKSRYYNAEEPWYLTYDSYTSTGIQGNNTQGGSYFVSKYYNSGLANINNNAGAASNEWSKTFGLSEWSSLDYSEDIAGNSNVYGGNIKYVTVEFKENSTYSKNPQRIKNLKVHGQLWGATYDIKINAEDNESGVKTVKFADGERNAEYFATNGTEVTGDKVTVNTNGTYTVYVEDKAGNKTVQTIIINQIDTSAPTNTAPTYTNTANSITVTNNQVDNESGIFKVEYAIKESGGEYGNWQSSNEFTGLRSSTTYNIKTRTINNANLKTESEEVTVTTDTIQYTITLDNQEADTAGTETIYEIFENRYSLTSGGQAMTPSTNQITKPEKTGSLFTGYYTGQNGTGTQVIDANGYISAGASNTLFTSDSTIYANWSTGSWLVTFDATGGTSSEPTRAVTYDAAVGTLPTADYVNHIFDGWYTAASGGTKITESTAVRGNVTYYAHWKDAIAEINGTYYISLAKAIEAVTTSDETTIRLVNDTSEKIKIENGRNIIFDFGTSTLRNNGANPVIENYGNLTFIGGNITTSANQGAINNKSGARLRITGGSITATGDRQTIYNEGGTTEIYGGYFSAKAAVASGNNRSTVQNKSGTMIITGGTIETAEGATNAIAVTNNGTMTIGTKDGQVNQTSPEITGAKYGINNEAAIKLYDGNIRGGTGSGKGALSNYASNKISDKEAGYGIDHETVDSYDHVIYVSAHTVTFNVNASDGQLDEELRKKTIQEGNQIGELPVPTRAGYTFLGWFDTSATTGGTQITAEDYIGNDDVTYYARWEKTPPAVINGQTYVTVQAAIDTCPAGGTVEIDVVADTTEEISIPAGKDVTINLNGYTVSNNGKKGIIKNKGSLTINGGDIDSTRAGFSAIDNDPGATLILDSVNIIAEGNPEENSTENRQTVYNKGGTVTIRGNTYLESKASGVTGGVPRSTINNLNDGSYIGTLIIESGTIVHKNTELANNKNACITNASGAVLIIGNKEGLYNQESPTIIGKKYGIYNAGTAKFYDGTINGLLGAIAGTVTTFAEIKDYHNQDTGTKQFEIDEVTETYNSIYLIRPIAFTPSTEEMTSGPITVTITYNSQIVSGQKAGYGTTPEEAMANATEGTANSVTVTANGYVYAEGLTSGGESVSATVEISNISN